MSTIDTRASSAGAGVGAGVELYGDGPGAIGLGEHDEHPLQSHE